MATYHVELLNRRGAPGTVHWHDWTAASWAAARAERKPVLLFLTASWSAGCAAMERDVFSAPIVAQAVRHEWIPIRVDADRRPDIDARYNLGGWPTTALLTAEGEILFGGTYFEARELAEALVRSRASVPQPAPPADRHQPADTPRARSTIDAGATDWAIEHLLCEADAVHGGFGNGPKAPSVGALALLLECYRRRADAALGGAIVRSLDAICEHLYDVEWGGFCRGADRRDWGGVRREKRLADNAALALLLLDAASLVDRPLYYERALDTIAWCRSAMTDPEQDGLFFSSVRAAVDDAEPGAVTPGVVVDRTVFADANAGMVDACLKVGETCGDTSLLELAVHSLERVVSMLYRPGAGVAHCPADVGQPRALLQDQVRVAAAFVTAARLTGRVPYVMLAEELMQFSRRTMWDDRGGGFFDRLPPIPARGDVGLLGERLTPFDLNCEAAATLVALSALSERAEYAEWAELALAAQTPVYRSHGVDAASYALASMALAAFRHA